MLTNYNGTNITYDQIGNPLNWRNATSLTWQGRRLTAMVVNGTAMSFEYNSDGIRQSKTYGNTTVNYITDGSKIIAEYSGNTYTYYIYDENGTIMGMMYNNQLYTFRKNLQGDVTGIYTANGNLVVEYTYSPYGEVLSVTGTLASTIGTANPFRYRGYYYDTETGFYYLNSRYYDPQICHFLNTDTIAILPATPMALSDKNLYAYCDNNPVVRVDNGGQFWDTVFDVVSLVVSVVDVCTDPSDGWAWAGLVGDVVDLIPFVCCVGEVVKGARATNKVIDTVDTIHDTVNAVDAAIDGFGNLSRARQYGINAYNELRKVLKGTGLEAHHIVEKRLVKHLNIDANTMLSVAVTPEEHRVFTNMWREFIPYGTNYKDLKPMVIYLYATQVYKDYPELLEAVKKTLFF